MTLNNKIALVTGASRGIGREIALAFAREGSDLVITARDVNRLETLREEAAALGVRCEMIAVDLARRDAAAQIWDRCRERFGRIDLLVNNAGVGSSADPRPVVDFDDDFWELTLFVNLTVPYLLSKVVLPGMLRRGDGRIINIASINGKVPSLHGSAYTASKHGLLGLTRTLALEVAGTGITVNAICPGPVRTLINDRRVAYDAALLGISTEEYEAGMTPLGRRLEASEIAPLAVFLAGPQAAVITGQAYNVDGGRIMF